MYTATDKLNNTLNANSELEVLHIYLDRISSIMGGRSNTDSTRTFLDNSTKK